jgi:hypothetical protein
MDFDFTMSNSAPFQFGLSSMLLITTLVAVIMSVSVMVPGIGISLAIVSVPALVRTYVLVRRRREAGMPATSHDKAVLFVMCLGIAVLISIATGAAFFASCFAGFIVVSSASGGRMSALDSGLMAGGILGTICGLALLIFLLVKWFRYPPDKLTTAQFIKAMSDNPKKPADGKQIAEKPIIAEVDPHDSSAEKSAAEPPPVKSPKSSRSPDDITP